MFVSSILIFEADMLLSVIIPFYYPDDKIITTLNSLKEQAIEDFEIILVNDGTPKDKYYFLDNYLKGSDFNYKVIHKDNGGVSSARNEGLSLACGEYVIFLDSDDIIMPYAIDKISEIIRSRNQIDCLLYDCIIESESGVELYNSHHVNSRNYIDDAIGLTTNFLLGSFYMNVMSVVHRVAHLNENDVMFNEKLKNGEDQAFNIKSISSSNYVDYYPFVLCKYIKHKSSYTSKEFEFSKFGIIDKYDDLFNKIQATSIITALNTARSRDVVYTISNISKMKNKHDRNKYAKFWYDEYFDYVVFEQLKLSHKFAYASIALDEKLGFLILVLFNKLKMCFVR